MQTLAQWLEERCQKESLSLRQAAVKTNLSHATISDIMKGGHHPSPETIRKLVRGFGNGTNERLALEDYLLTLAGYRTPRGREETSVTVAEVMDKVSKLSEPQVKMVGRFADFLTEIEDED